MHKVLPRTVPSIIKKKKKKKAVATVTCDRTTYMCVWAGVFVVTSFSASVFLTFGETWTTQPTRPVTRMKRVSVEASDTRQTLRTKLKHTSHPKRIKQSWKEGRFDLSLSCWGPISNMMVQGQNVWNVAYQGHWEGLTTFIQPRCSVTVLTTHVGLSELGSLSTHKKPVFPVEELSQRDQYWQIPYTEHFSTKRGRVQEVPGSLSYKLNLTFVAVVFTPWILYSPFHKYTILIILPKVNNSMVWNESQLAGVTLFNSSQAT